MQKLLWITAVLIIVFSVQAQAQMYIWVDKDGVKTFSNTAPPPEKDFKALSEKKSSRPQAAETYTAPATTKKRVRIKTTTKTTTIKKPKRQEKRKYKISMLQARKDPRDSKYIIVSCRINGGEPCNNLHVTLYMHNSGSGKIRAEDSVGKAGGSQSPLFRSRVRVGSKRAQQNWQLSSPYFRCN